MLQTESSQSMLATKSHSKSQSLLEIIRNDHNSLVSIFDTTADNKLANVTQLLRELIEEGNEEIKSINDSFIACNKLVAELKANLESAEAQLKVHEERLNEAINEEARLLGVMNEANRIYNRDSPAVKKEIDVLNKVNNILTDLLNNTGKDLAEEDATEVRAFISLVDQADPAKVKRITVLVDKLLKAALDELALFEKAVQDATEAHEAAVKQREQLAGVHHSYKQVVTDAEKAYNDAVGRCDANFKSGTNRKTVVLAELQNLNEVVSIIEDISSMSQ